MQIIKINNLETTKDIAKIISNNLSKGSVLCLDGDLGAGKTTLTQFIAKEIGVVEQVTSPTFTIIKEYQAKLPLYHMDVYRIEDIDDMYDLGFEEYIYSDGICIIEWSKKIEKILPKDRINIKIQIENDARIMCISGSGFAYENLKEELKKNENISN